MLLTRKTRLPLGFFIILILIAAIFPNRVFAGNLEDSGERPPVFIEFEGKHYIETKSAEEIYAKAGDNIQQAEVLYAKRMLEFKYRAESVITLTITDQWGNEVGKRRLEVNQNTERSKVPVNRWKAGVYTIIFETEGFEDSYKLVVE